MNLTRLSVNNPAAMAVVVAMIALFGTIAVLGLPIQLDESAAIMLVRPGGSQLTRISRLLPLQRNPEALVPCCAISFTPNEFASRIVVGIPHR